MCLIKQTEQQGTTSINHWQPEKLIDYKELSEKLENVLNGHKSWLEREIKSLESHKPVKGFEEVSLDSRRSEFTKGVLYFCKMSLENIKDLESDNPICLMDRKESK